MEYFNTNIKCYEKYKINKAICHTSSPNQYDGGLWKEYGGTGA